MKECPKCNLSNPPDAQRCDCGYDFASGQIKKSYIANSPSTSNRPWMNFGLILSYLIVMIAAGHGVGPIGLLLILGAAPEYFLPQILGWISIVLLIVAFSQNPSLGIQTTGLLLIFLSWIFFIRVVGSQHIYFPLLTSIPFLLILIFSVYRLIMDFKINGSTS